jgi:hypothetical protein
MQQADRVGHERSRDASQSSEYDGGDSVGGFATRARALGFRSSLAGHRGLILAAAAGQTARLARWADDTTFRNRLVLYVG